MMFFKAAVVSTVAILATAAPNPWGPGTVTVTATAPGPTVTTISQCNTGGAQCCNSVGAANSLPGVGAILGLLGIVIQDLSVVVGLGCANIAGGSCNQQPVCCTDNHFNGLINIGCSPIS
ncbi:fungal hydrophobin-domain-containing protein [Gautieria morchelliformis]|nr:fungal hydrophobin-domain-containing protein [Gautieria morchelliformis]